jgi:hypothetical protein
MANGGPRQPTLEVGSIPMAKGKWHGLQGFGWPPGNVELNRLKYILDRMRLYKTILMNIAH